MTMTLAKQYVTFSQAANARSVVVLCVVLFLPIVVGYRQEVLLWMQMKEPPTTIVFHNPR
jgi:hypothetical protein